MKNTFLLLATCLIGFTALAQLQNNCTTTNFLTKRDASGNLICSSIFDDGLTTKIGSSLTYPNKIMLGNFSNPYIDNSNINGGINLAGLTVHTNSRVYGNFLIYTPVENPNDNANALLFINNKKSASGVVSSWSISDTAKGLEFNDINNSANAFLIQDLTYNVGIGTTVIPTGYKLAVNGKIIAEELRVQLRSTWPDYVFGSEYKLPTLQEVEKQIKDKGHLTKMPSAKEVETNGIAFGEMNKLLLEKVEELTLYAIEQNKTNLQQTKQIEDLKVLVKTLIEKNK